MKLLYSDILPLGTEDDQQTIIDCFKEQLNQADSVEIAVGYVSRASLEELDTLISDSGVKHICLNIGMYYIEGMPEGSYHTALKINRKWRASGIGEIKIVRAFKYHGKLYCFYKDGVPFSAIMGSANLGVIKLEASNRRQYELSSLVTKIEECQEISAFIESLMTPKFADPIIAENGTPSL